MYRRRSRWTSLLPVIPPILASSAPLAARDEARAVTHLYEAWASVGTFWDEYLARILEVTPADEVDTLFRMVEAHEDEIWTLGTPGEPVAGRAGPPGRTCPP
jgi:hypothetical protein